ncbi:hypothetical protein [Propionivibrio sp.]|uniref:hypothetical protein n=1 Tax=Propionivibrio sp. TaxID=2212460 RepID=UPI00260F5915|nr:hypothetical protein [Propionivibrio sp.]
MTGNWAPQGANGKGRLSQLDERTAGIVTSTLHYAYDSRSRLTGATHGVIQTECLWLEDTPLVVLQ